MPDGRRAWHGLSERQQPVKHSGVSAAHFDYLRPARRPRYQRYLLAADTERGGDRGEGSGGGLTVHRTGADPDNQRATVLAAYPWVG
jgi:hypothetical protein